MKSKILQIKNTKDLLQKLLKERLDNSLLNLELKYQKDLKTLSLITNSSKDILNNLSELSENSVKNTEKTKNNIPKLHLEMNNNNLNKSQYNKTKTQRSKKDEFCIEFDSILKNKKQSNKKSIEKRQLSVNKKNNTIKTKVSFIKKKSICLDQSNITPNPMKKIKTFFNNINNTSYKNGKKFFKLKNTLNGNYSSSDVSKKKKIVKNLKERNNFTPNKISETNNKKKHKHNMSFNTNNNDIISRFSKKVLKTMTNFYNKKNKIVINNYINEFILDKDNDDINKKIEKNEQHLNSLCDSLLIDVNKDELLVNNSKIMLNDGNGNELVLRKISNNEDGGGAKNQKIFLYEKFKACIQYFIDYSTIKDVFILCQTKKEILKIVMNLKINNTKKINDQINLLLKTKNINNNNFSLSQKIKPFELNSTSMKAITALNSISKSNFLKSIMHYTEQRILNHNIIRKIILIFDIYFIALGKKNIINDFNGNNSKKLEYICDYFKNKKNKSIGNIIKNDLNGIKLDDFIINGLYEYSHNYINIINPGYYKRINKDIAIFVFLIKHLLDYVGITNIDKKDICSNNKNTEQRTILINKSRLNINNILLEKYNKFLKNVNNY